jgi:hypothetical protein
MLMGVKYYRYATASVNPPQANEAEKIYQPADSAASSICMGGIAEQSKPARPSGPPKVRNLSMQPSEARCPAMAGSKVPIAAIAA